jgi:acyl carrier protein
VTQGEAIEDYIFREVLFNDRSRLCGPEEILIGSGGIVDSFGLNNLILFIEDELGVTIDDVDVVPENFNTLNALTDFVTRKLEGKSA